MVLGPEWAAHFGLAQPKCTIDLPKIVQPDYLDRTKIATTGQSNMVVGGIYRR